MNQKETIQQLFRDEFSEWLDRLEVLDNVKFDRTINEEAGTVAVEYESSETDNLWQAFVMGGVIAAQLAVIVNG